MRLNDMNHVKHIVSPSTHVSNSALLAHTSPHLLISTLKAVITSILTKQDLGVGSKWFTQNHTVIVVNWAHLLCA